MVAALLAVYILWGSTAPAIKVAVATVPPFVLAGTRYLVAGTLLWLWSRARNVPLPSAREWRGAVYSAALLLALSNAMFGWSLQYIPAGVGSLFFALSPIWNALIATVFYRERIAPKALCGILLGLGGMAYLIAPGGTRELPLIGSLVAVGTSISWSVGSMIQRRYAGGDALQMSGMQMLAGFAMMLVAVPLTGERIVPSEFTPQAILALAFLVIFGSLVAYSAYVWLMRTQTTALASTNAYVNPIVALVIATSLLGEKITLREIVASAIVLTGVALMMLPSRAGAARAVASAD